MNVESALRVSDPDLGLTAHLPTGAPAERARYWLDINGGSDLGGLTYFFRTGRDPEQSYAGRAGFSA